MSKTKDEERIEYRQTFDLFYIPTKPWLAALISFAALGFGGVGQLLLGQPAKAVVLLLVEWILILTGFLLFDWFSETQAVFLILFHTLTACDAWVIARRIQKSGSIRKFEWFWSR